jgi:hypothetical protein
VDETARGQLHDHSHEFCVEFSRVWYTVNHPHGEGIDELHDDGVSAPCHGLGHREAFSVQNLHESVLLLCCKGTQVHPTSGIATTKVVTIRFDCAEGYATQSVELEDQLSVCLCGADVDVRFLADTNLVAETVDGIALPVGVHGEVVQATIRKTVTVILGVLDLRDQAIFGQSRDVPVHSTSTTLAG